MIALGIESSALTASVAIADDNSAGFKNSSGPECKFIFTQTTSLKHSQTLLPMLESGLEKSGYTIKDVELIAVTNGPGSFTGVRIGVSMVKGLAFGKNVPCVGVSTLESLAYNLMGFEGILCPVMDARRGQLYNALFESDGKNIIRKCDDRLISADMLKNELEMMNGKIYFCGDGYHIARENIIIENVKQTPPALINQSAFSTCLVALKIYKGSAEKEKYTDENLLPLYLRPSQAEREANGSSGKKL